MDVDKEDMKESDNQGIKKPLFAVVTPHRSKQGITLKEQDEKKEKKPILTTKVSYYEIGPTYLNKKIKREEVPSKITTQIKVLPKQPPTLDNVTIRRKVLERILSRPANPVKNKQLKLQILYMNIQSKFQKNKPWIEDVIRDYDPPDIIILHEVPPNIQTLFPEYRTQYAHDGSKKMAVLISRDRSPNEITVVMKGDTPYIKVLNHEIWVIHTLNYDNQNMYWPEAQDNRTLIGDFNIRSNLSKVGYLDTYKNAAIEPRWCVGIFSNVNQTAQFESIQSDHYSLRAWLDVPKPKPFYILRKAAIDKTMTRLLLSEDLPNVYTGIKSIHRWNRVKVFHRFKKFWQLKTDKINYAPTKFIQYNMLSDQIKEDIDKLYTSGKYVKEKDPILFDELDCKILRHMLRLFFSYPLTYHLKSKARDFNGISYNHIVRTMFKKPITEFWVKRLTSIWTSTRYVITKMIPLKKRNRVESIDDIRFIGIQDSFVKLYEQIYKPILFDLQLHVYNLNPNQHGFLPGVSTISAVEMMTQQHIRPRRIKDEELIPDTRLNK
jgi:hypothetical protein